MAGDGDEEFQNAAAQKPAGDAFKECVRVILFGEAPEDNRPNDPEADQSKNDTPEDAPIGIAGIGGLGVERG